MRDPGRAIGREVAGGERADAELDSFIARRHEQRQKSEGDRVTEDFGGRQSGTRLPAGGRRTVPVVLVARDQGGAVRSIVGGARGHRGGAARGRGSVNVHGQKRGRPERKKT